MIRTLDILFSSIALILLLPFFCIISLILKLTGENKVFFLQKRVGKNNQSFSLIKFATMLENSPNIGTGTITIKNDPRILPFGYFLRKTKINELPQLINVLMGDMSLIGPRPLTDNEFNQYADSIKAKLNTLSPGLSGIGSIVFRNEENIIGNDINNINEVYRKKIIPFKGELEIWYVNNRNIYTYFVLIIMTLIVIFIPNTKIHYKLFKDLPKFR